ncbi:hypothetical protein AB3N02_21795 [Priestia aryabhattai]|uniref:hypothetical protein n=1 Tax=Priestia aryabhattai TaxID=412384 RepID=UPI0039A19DBB
MSNDIYYRILDYKGKLTIVCMQWFDEYDYNEEDFLTDEDGDRYMFHTKNEAIDWLNENVKEEYIDDEYKHASPKSKREKYLK